MSVLPQPWMSMKLLYDDYGQQPSLLPLAVHDPVLGHGSYKPWAVLVGEAPGGTEVTTGIPFTGRAGQRLNTHLGGFRDECWTTNILKFRPVTTTTFTEVLAGEPTVVTAAKDRPPRPQEIAESMPYFWRELSLVAAPHTRLICAMGRTAASAILGADVKISALHGQWVNRPVSDPGGEKWFVYVTYHPAAALRDPGVDQDLAADLSKFTEEAGMYRSQALDILGGRA